MSWIDDPWMGFDTKRRMCVSRPLCDGGLVLCVDGASPQRGRSTRWHLADRDPGIGIPSRPRPPLEARTKTNQDSLCLALSR